MIRTLILFIMVMFLPLLSKLPDNMVLIKSGWFNIGSLQGNNDEKPVKRVYIDDFYLSESEVTIWEYLEAVQAGAVKLPDWWNREYFPENHQLSGQDWLNLPITGISWLEAKKFCKWKGSGYRLPSEAEWEYAARAGSQAEYLWGDNSPGGDWFFGYDSIALKYAAIKDGLQPVKSFCPNQFGLYDMTGNVWEWCEDVYNAEFYLNITENNPLNTNEKANESVHTVRGGSWDEYSFNLRLANRSFGDAISGYRNVGFRIVYEAKE